MTDIDGSTRLWQDAPDAMRAALARHDAIAAAIVAQHHGFLLKSRGEGDSTFSVFARATDGVAAACAMQEALTSEPWPEDAPLVVRIALHSGEADLGVDDYYGLTVNRCARLRGTAHGGQVLLSEAAAALARGGLPSDATLLDMGIHQLRDLAEPEHVYQLVHPGLTREFPALRTIDVVPNNLPLQVSSFVGRDEDIVAIKGLIQETRLLTLTGPGGVGKTRLALQTAAEALCEHPDGAWLVDLGSLSDEGLVAQAVATVLDVREEPGRDLPETLVRSLRDRRLLLVLDNCEHLVDACSALAERITAHCPRVQVLATSREALRAEGETVWRVPPLSVPTRQPETPLAPEELAKYGAVRLFVDRAMRAQPGFALTDGNAPAVAQICARLDGVPLAIELAAARTGVLSPKEVEERLDQRFRLLTGGRRTALPRHQTLEATVRWSYELLSEQEQRLFGRLSVFAGGFTLAAAEQVCSGHEIEAADVPGLLGELASKSLVTPGNEASFVLETLRVYGRQRLEELGEAERTRGRHAYYFASLVREARSHERTREETRWLDRLDAHQDDLRAAIEWLRAADPEGALGMANSLSRFFFVRGYWRQGSKELRDALDSMGSGHSEACADGLVSWGVLTAHQGHRASGREAVEQGLAMSQSLGYARGIATALYNLALFAGWETDWEVAKSLVEESLSLRRQVAPLWAVAECLHRLGWIAQLHGDYAGATAAYEESLALGRQAGNLTGVSGALLNLGTIATLEGDLPRARALQEEALAMRIEMGDRRGMAESHYNLGSLAIESGELDAASASLEECLRLSRDLGDARYISGSMCDLAWLAVERGAFEEARDTLEESIALSREVDHHSCTAQGLSILATLTLEAGPAKAATLYREALRLRRENADDDGAARTLMDLGVCALREGQPGQARAWIEEGLGLAHGLPRPQAAVRIEALGTRLLAQVSRAEGDLGTATALYAESAEGSRCLGDFRELAACAEGMALVSLDQGDPERAARQLGAAHALRGAQSVPVRPVERAEYDRTVCAVREALEEEAFAAAWAEGENQGINGCLV